jgi:hypothetical protein
MKPFSNFIDEEIKDTGVADTKKSVTSFIASNLQRFANSSEETDIKAILMLVAALSLLDASDDNPTALQTARRLATMALVKSTKKKGK